MTNKLSTISKHSTLTCFWKNIVTIGLLMIGSLQLQAQKDTIVIIFAPTATSADIIHFKTALNAKQLDISYPSEARLWEIECRSGKVCKFMGTAYSDVNEVIKKVSSQTKTESIGKNYFTFTPSFINVPAQEPQGPFTTKQLTACNGVPIVANKGTANEQVTIALIDSGVDNNHPFFKYSGYFTSTSRSFIGANPFNDHNGHGTHIAGIIRIMDIIGGGTNSFQIMNLQTQEPDGSGKVWNAIRAVDWANTHGADIINMSIGYIHDPLIESVVGKQPLEVAIEKANHMHDVLVVASAGNEADDIDLVKHYPSAFASDNLISVASDSCSLSFSTSFSNFGVTNVDLAAPGENILGPNLHGHTPQWTRKTGTSMAAGIVTGAAAILATHISIANDGQLKCAILDGADFQGYPVMTEGTLHTPDALDSLQDGSCATAAMRVAPPTQTEAAANPLVTKNKYGIEAFPQPFTHTINLQFTARESGSANWFILDAFGRIIDHGELLTTEGLNRMTWDGSQVRSGLYWFNINLTGQRPLVRKMLKQWE
ncbi:MAG: S8 family serine peptidase [Bacteroidota bacterium]